MVLFYFYSNLNILKGTRNVTFKICDKLLERKNSDSS